MSIAANLAPTLRQRFFDANNLPLSGGKLHSYQAGTTTPQATYTDQGGGTPNANPVVMDANGYADVWLDPSLSYKFVLADSNDVPLWTVDNVIGTLINNAVSTATIQDAAVTSAKLAASAVTLAKLDPQVFGAGALLNFSLTAVVGSNDLVITLKDGTGGIPDANSPVKVGFRSSPATSGVPVFRSVTSAITGTVMSGSTLGSVNAKPNWIYVYLIDNAGTVELAWSGSKSWDEGSLQNTTADAGTATSKTVLYSNNARTGVAIRLISRIKSTQATAGTWASAPSELSLAPFEQRAPRSEVWVYTGNGYGATNTVIRRFTTVGKNVGSAITYADDANTGASFTINEDGLYAVSYSESLGGNTSFGVSVNSSELTTGISSIIAADRRFMCQTASATDNPTCGGVLALSAGDVVRPHADSTAQTASTPAMHFRIVKITD